MNVGIDLGTTNSALAFIDTKEAAETDFPEIRILDVPQTVAQGRVEARRRISQVAPFDQQARSCRSSILPRAHRIFPIARARIAMRVGTPFRTSSRIRACGPSATSLVSSNPRMIGPGCITIASFFAIFNRAVFIW